MPLGDRRVVDADQPIRPAGTTATVSGLEEHAVEEWLVNVIGKLQYRSCRNAGEASDRQVVEMGLDLRSDLITRHSPDDQPLWPPGGDASRPCALSATVSAPRRTRGAGPDWSVRAG
jgi:hypothetical protein